MEKIHLKAYYILYHAYVNLAMVYFAFWVIFSRVKILETTRVIPYTNHTPRNQPVLNNPPRRKACQNISNIATSLAYCTQRHQDFSDNHRRNSYTKNTVSD